MNRALRKYLFVYLGLVSSFVLGQQESQFTQYMFVPQIFNPAYAGNRGITSLRLLARSQWLDLEGAPKTNLISFDSPLGSEGKVGLGGTIFYEQIGPLTETNFSIDYSYSINFMFSKLSFGLKAGLNSYDIDFNKLNIYDQTDPYIDYAVNNKYQPQIGVGIFYNTQKYYLGVSAPNLLEKKYFDLVDEASSFFTTFSKEIHLYVFGGYVFDLHPSLKFKPATLVKAVKGSPIQWDISLNFIVNNNFTFGVANRIDSAITTLAGIQLSDSMMVGFSYDFATTEIRNSTSGTFEVLFRFDFGTNKKILTPRFF
ncbi:MAG: type IX secretion system membrane protein PorP/SprF [Flavobacteriaceae bacterium]|nr:type IX secretion system membrane protein PorP/SprF [Flavobacteriaceae bacterium]